jgi:hypothetical protein
VVPYLEKTYAFYTCSTTYKKQGAPDQWSLIQQKLILFTRVTPRVKSKELHRYVLQIYYFINQVSKSFADQRVSSSLCIIQTISHQILIGGSIYFPYTCVINIQEGRGIYLYLSSSSSSNMQKKNIYKALGLLLSSNSARLVKSYEDMKS